MIYEIDTFAKLESCCDFEYQEYEKKIQKILLIYVQNHKLKKDSDVLYNDEIYIITKSAVNYNSWDFHKPHLILRGQKITDNMKILKKNHILDENKLEIISYDEATELVGKKRGTRTYADKQLYIFKNPYNLIKIGISSNIQERKMALEMASGYDLEILKIINKPELESKLHKKFSHLKVKGEWFKFTDEIRLEIAKLEI